MSTIVPVRPDLEVTLGDGVSSRGDLNGATHVIMQQAVDRLPSASITMTITGSPNTSAAVVEIDTSNEAGSVVTHSVTASQTPASEAEDLYDTLIASTDITTIFKVTWSGTTVTLKPRVGYSGYRRVTMRIVSGSGVTWTNLDGSSVSTSSVPPALVRMGGTVRFGRGLFGNTTESPLTIDTPNVRLIADHGATMIGSKNGWFVCEASGFRCDDFDIIWPAPATSSERNNKILCLMACSDFEFSGCSFSVDSQGSSGSGETCFVIASTQLTGLFPHHASRSYIGLSVRNCNFYLGNRVTNIFFSGVFHINLVGCLFTALYSRTNAFGNGNKLLTESPSYCALLRNSDYIDMTDCSFMNMGGHSDADISESWVTIDRTGPGFDSSHEGGHITIKGCRFHGSRNTVGAQLLLRRLWFVRVTGGCEFHRHLIEDPSTIPRWRRACISVQDCVTALISDTEFFNLGADSPGTDYANYAAVAGASLRDPVSESAGPTSRILSLANIHFDNKVASKNNGLTDLHPLLWLYNVQGRPRFDAVSVSDCVLITGGQATARFTITDNANLGNGDGFVFRIPEDTFGTGLPAVTGTGDLVISAILGTDWAKSAGGAWSSAVLLMTYLRSTELGTYFEITVDEDDWKQESSANTSATVLMHCKTYGAAGNACSIEHVSATTSTTSNCSAGGVDVPENTDALLGGGFGQASSDGQIAIILDDDPFGTVLDATPKNALTCTPPKQASIKGNSFRGWLQPVAGTADTMNTITDDNEIVV